VPTDGNPGAILGIREIRRRLRILADKDKARILRGFFKTGRGQYGEGDVFIGVTVPVLRKLAKEFCDTLLDDVVLLLQSPIHEERLLALLMLVRSYATGSKTIKKKIFNRYIANTRYENSSMHLRDRTTSGSAGSPFFQRSPSSDRTISTIPSESPNCC